MDKPDALIDMLSTISAVDHHCHGVIEDAIDADRFQSLATESDLPQTADAFDSPVGVAIRAECAPLLGLPRHVDGASYLGARAELGPREVTRRLLSAANISTYLVDTGYGSDDITTPAELAGYSGGEAFEIVRLESLAERLARSGCTASGFSATFRGELESALRTAVGVKSIMAYRYGLDFDPARPTEPEIRSAVDQWLRSGEPRLTDPVVLRALLWAAVDAGRPIQMHVGFGDSDIVLHRCDPTRMTEFLRATVSSGTPIMLLHNYPFVREAGYLAHVYPHVYLDTGLAAGFSGASATAIVRQSLEIAPFTKVLFSTDAFGLPELYLVGARVHRLALARVLGEWLAADAIGEADARRYSELLLAGNARRVYGLNPR
ncbi:amidohydrolase family protein [Allokutzneria sp. A3M-2-11 16]|uniref:amidohydrolase family protein n=1 Tax=Allokutzneria sp. A3M-2-11 16 TaxID=2962043 RepID=UPI0020B871FC|nr:amidohydrolase family protein [Allokutzneria sp. A3M-2-11 16]MCP3805030.1 amidohydrolase family protein [Allokutzneria sp. A3M-2-11 16]